MHSAFHCALSTVNLLLNYVFFLQETERLVFVSVHVNLQWPLPRTHTGSCSCQSCPFPAAKLWLISPELPPCPTLEVTFTPRVSLAADL